MRPSTEKLVEQFDGAAQSHGWSEDQGSSAAAHSAKVLYELTKATLLRRVKWLENRIAKLKK